MKFRFLFVPALSVVPLFAQYAGPAIISRGEAPTSLSLPQIRFTPSVLLTETYDSGLSNTKVGQNGELAHERSLGQSLTWNVSGVHSWKHTRLALQYNGSLNRYSRESAFNNMSQTLMLGVSHRVSSRISVELRQMAGMTSRNYVIGGLAQTVPFDPTSTYVPTTDYFDNRTVFLTSVAGVTYQRTKRLSFSFSSNVFMNNRESRSLTSAWGTTETGDVQYRLSGRSTLGGTYSFMHFGYANIGGGTDAHSTGLVYSRAINRSTEFSLQAGGTRVESKFVRVTAVDPAIVALLGITQTAQIAHTILYSPSGMARLSRSFYRGVAYVSGGRSVTPGNGLFLTSMATTVFGGYNYAGFRRWSLNAQVGYIRSSADGSISGEYGNRTENVTAGRKLGRYLWLNAGVSSRTYFSPDYVKYNRRVTTASLGLAFSPGELRLPTW